MQPFYAAAICNIFVRAQAAAFGAAGYQILIKIQKPINAPRQETKGGEILALSEKINLHAACSMQSCEKSAKEKQTRQLYIRNI